MLNNFVSGPSFHPGRSRLPGALVWLLCQSVISRATPQETTVPGDSIPPGKGDYTLFNPTPARYLRELTPDRPDKTESPYTVDAGHFQLEMDVANFTRDRTGGRRAEAWNFAPLIFKAGLLDNTDLQFIFGNYLHVRTEDNAIGTTTTQSGVGDFTARLKINLWGDGGGPTALAAPPFVKFPTSTDDLGNDAVNCFAGVTVRF